MNKATHRYLATALREASRETEATPATTFVFAEYVAAVCEGDGGKGANFDREAFMAVALLPDLTSSQQLALE